MNLGEIKSVLLDLKFRASLPPEWQQEIMFYSGCHCPGQQELFLKLVKELSKEIDQWIRNEKK